MRALVGPLLLAGLSAVALHAQTGPRWSLAYFYDVDRSTLAIHELRFSDASHGVALAELNDNGKNKHVSLLTSDGGATWTLSPLKKMGISLFFLNASDGWMVAEDGIYRTTDAGATFTRISKRKDVLRLWFLDASHGFAAGTRKRVWETTDGGLRWTELKAASEPGADPDGSVYTCIDFVPPLGIIVGHHQPAVPFGRRGRQRLLPSTTILLQTTDAGKTWKSGTSSLFGRVSQYKLDGFSAAYVLMEFDSGFDYPSEFYRIDARTGRAVRLFRERNRAVTDFALDPGHTVWLAAIEPPGSDPSLPIPGKVKMLYSDGADWKEAPVDYRAVASRIVMASVPGGGLFAATDTGMILSLNQE